MTKISGYITIKNAVQMDYPFVQSIKSLLEICDEVICIDSSNVEDGTQDVLQDLMNEYGHLNVFHVDLNWNASNFGIYDGQLKALARSKCTGDYCIQLDADEVFEPNIRSKIDEIIQNNPSIVVLALPVVEFWGSKGKIRVDVNPWKERLSKNDPNITHGIPITHRKIENGLLYSKPGSDGCNLIYKDSGKPVPTHNFMTQQIEQLRQMAIHDERYTTQYGQWFQHITQQLPTVYHFSWYSIKSKILKYKYFWNNSWLSLYNEQKPEGWNPFFSDKSLSEVSDEEIKNLAVKLERETGGHVFHTAWVGQKTNHVKLNTNFPVTMNEWIKNHQD